MPRLTADEWAPSSRSYDALEAALTDGSKSAFEQDSVANDARETQRVLHVGLTRAEDMLILHGQQEDDTDTDEDPIHEVFRNALGTDLPWEPDASHLPIWQNIQQCLPPSTSDWTASLAASVVGDIGGIAAHEGESLATDLARECVLTLGHELLDGSVGTAEASRLSVDALSGPPDVAPAARHSYTSLKTFEECPRKHYLEYVVNAFPNHRPDDDWVGTDDGPSQRTVGVLFHDIAEAAGTEGKTTRDEWYEICERLANQRRAHDVLETAKTCIDRYFELGINDWELIDAERHFEITVDGEDVVGFIDAVYRTPADELIVVDYKDTERERYIDENRQLPLYLLACRDLYGQPIRRAGYAYVARSVRNSTLGSSPVTT